MAGFFRCLFGPRLSKIYPNDLDSQQRRGALQEGQDYQGNFLENFSDGLIKTAMCSISIAWSLGFYTCPFIALWMYRRGYFYPEYIHGFGRLASAITILFFSIFLTRGIGRMMNSDYIQFISLLDSYKASRKENLKAELGLYDFEFHEWPVDFRYNDTVVDASKPRKYIEKRTSRRTNMLDKLQSLPCGIISYIAIHTFGRRLIYPGSLTIIHLLLNPMLIKGRARLIMKFAGVRYKLLAKDGNEIDSMVIDRRNQERYPHGNILVICCEGNSGFYEYGITNSPLEAGYSIMGWNHPGFGGSTGVPFPENEINAIDIVMQFAIHKLNFKPENIVIYAWSIGGFTATWAAMNYPDIHGLILDATFDDLVPLAVARMPPSWKPLVIRTVRDYMDLNNGEQLIKYDGPVLFVRRTKDEMISTKPSRPLQTNRGNDLLVKFLQYRYPNIITDQTVWALHEWLTSDDARQNELWSTHGVDDDICSASLISYVTEHSSSFPMQIGHDMSDEEKIPFIFFLALRHMMDYDATHCSPLPSQIFYLPWSAVVPGADNIYEGSKL